MHPSRAVLAVAVLVAGWTGVHLLTTHPAPVSPAVWPGAASPAGSPAPVRWATPATVRPSSSPSAGAVIPILPDVLRRLNADTGTTANGLYRLLQELEGALGTDIEAVVHQLEPRR